MSSSQQKTILVSHNAAATVLQDLTTITDHHGSKGGSADFGDLSVGLASHETGASGMAGKEHSATTSGEGSYHNNSPQGESSDASIEHCSLLSQSTKHNIATHNIADGPYSYGGADATIVEANEAQNPQSQNSSMGSSNGEPTITVVPVLISTTAMPINNTSSDNVSSSPETNAYNAHAASSSFEEDRLLIGGSTSCTTSNASAIRENTLVDTNDPALPRQFSPSSPPSLATTASVFPPANLHARSVTLTSQTNSVSSRKSCPQSGDDDDCGIELEIDESGYADEDDEKDKNNGSSDEEPVSPILSTSTALPPCADDFQEFEYSKADSAHTFDSQQNRCHSSPQSHQQHLGCTSVPYSSHRSFRSPQSFVTSALSAPPIPQSMGGAPTRNIPTAFQNILPNNTSNSNSANASPEKDSWAGSSSEDDEDLFLTRQRSDVWKEDNGQDDCVLQLDDFNSHCQYTSYSLAPYCDSNAALHKQCEADEKSRLQFDAYYNEDNGGLGKDRRRMQNGSHHHSHNNNNTSYKNVIDILHRRANNSAHYYANDASHAQHNSSTTSSNGKKKASKGGKRNRNFALIAASSESPEADDLLGEECEQLSLDNDDEEELIAGNVEDIDLNLEDEDELEADDMDPLQDELGNEEDNEEGAFESDELDFESNNSAEQNFYDQGDYQYNAYSNNSNTCQNRADASHLNLDEQRSIIAFAKRQRANEYNESMCNQQQLRGDQQSVSIKILLNEAHRHQIMQLRSAKASQSRISEAHGSWREVGFNAEDDFTDPQFVQRRLSCMCMFTPTLANRSYQDNDGERGARIRRQHDLLVRLQVQRSQGGNPFFFEGPEIQGQHVVQLTSEFEKQPNTDDSDFETELREEEDNHSAQAQYIPRRSEIMVVHIASPSPSTPEEGDEDESCTCIHSSQNEYDWINQDPTVGRGSSHYDTDQTDDGHDTHDQSPSTEAKVDLEFDDELDESDALLLSVL